MGVSQIVRAIQNKSNRYFQFQNSTLITTPHVAAFQLLTILLQFNLSVSTKRHDKNIRTEFLAKIVQHQRENVNLIDTVAEKISCLFKAKIGDYMTSIFIHLVI